MRVSISLLSFAAAESPCPSERCWSFDEASGNCELLPGCAEVSCDANALRIEFVPEYFGVENNGEAEFADSYFDDGKYFTNCNLGECGMRADYNEDGDIVFSVEIQDEQQSITIGDLELFQESQPTTLTASCVYASTVSVSSNAFNLTFADASHDLVGVGDFGSQFSMSISDKDGETGGDIMIGEPVTVDIEWQKELNYLGFFPTDCYVALGGDDEQQAEIIKGGCFSSTLGVTKTGPYGEKLHESKAGFTFKSFSGSSELTSQNVKITCDLKICFFGDEACYETPSCPTEPAGYEYTEFGCSEEEQRPDKNGVCFEDKCFGGGTGKCTAWGDPHYTTFDGEQHHYMGTCWHTFAKSTAEGSVDRPAFQFEAKTDDFGWTQYSAVSGIRLFVNGEGDPVRSSGEFRYKIEALKTQEFWNAPMSGVKILDQETGQEYENFFDGDGLWVAFSNDGIAITTWFGLKINYQNQNAGLDLILPDCYRKAVNGLCGNWDGITYDQGLPEINYKDIESHPENVKHMVLEWSNWAENFVVPDDQCVAGPPGAANLSHLRAERKRRALDEAGIVRAVGLCEKLKSTNPLFVGCPADKPSQFAECIFDVAVDENNYCESAAKARDCIRSRNDPNAAVCDWANSLGCPQTCPENSEFKGCANVCESEKTCQNRWQRNRCNGKNQLDSRCTCKAGFMFEGNKCVPEKNCGCVYGSSYYPIGAKWKRDTNYNCECIGGNSNGGYTRCQSDSCYNKDNCVDFSSYPNPLWTQKNNQIGEIPVSINFELGINVIVYGPNIRETPEWKNVVHITNNGNYGSHGERIFGIWQNRQNQRNLLYTVGSPFSNQYLFQNAYYDEPCPIDKWCDKNYILKRFQNPSNPELVTTQLLHIQGSVFTAITKGLNVLDHNDYELVMEFDALKQDVLQSGTAKVFASDPWHTTASYIPVRQLYYQTFSTIGRSCSDIIDPCSGKKDCQTFVNSCAINPTRSNEVGIVEKPFVHFKISADVQCTNLHEINQWFSIFHVTTGENRGSFGSRIFAIWKQNGRASSYHVPVNHHSEGQPYYQRVFYPDCENGEWDTHEMEQRQSDTDQAVTVTEYRQIRNGVVVFSGSYEQQTSDLLLDKQLHVYVGDPWYAPGSGFMVRNFFYQKLGCLYGDSYYSIGAKWQVYANYNCECIGGTNGGYTRCKSDSCYNKDNCVDLTSYPNVVSTRKDYQIGEIPVSINFELGITLQVYGPNIKETPEWKNVVHITNNGNFGSHGERIFGIWQNHQYQRNLVTAVGSPFSSQHFQNVFREEPCPIDKNCYKNYVLKRFQNPSNPELVTTQLFYYEGSVFSGIIRDLNVLDHYDYELVMEFDALKQDVLQSGTAKVFASDPWHTTASHIPVQHFYYQTFPTIERSCSDISDPCSGKNDCQTFVNSCAINPTRSNEVGIVEKPYVHFKISADVQCTNLHEINQWFSIFHVTTGEDSGSFGSRIFAIWKSIGRASTFHVPVNHHSEGQRYYQRVFYPECENGEWDTHEMEQRQSDTDQAVTVTEYRQIRNGVVMFSGSYEQQTSDLLLYKKFHVYVGDPWYAPGSGFMVRNFFYQKLNGDPNPNPSVCADPCFGKQNCVTIVDCNEIYPEYAKIAGIITNPSRHFRFSFDFKCTSERDPELTLNSANALMLNTVGTNTATKVSLRDYFGETLFQIVTLRDDPMNVIYTANEYNRDLVGTPGRKSYNICPTTEWESFVYEQKALDSTTTATSLTRTSDGTVIISHTDLTSDLPDMPDTLYVMAGAKTYRPSRLFPVRNVAFENL